MGVFSTRVRSRTGSTRVASAQATSFQSRTSMSSSTTMMILVYMNWRSTDHRPNITRFACPAYSFLIETMPIRYEHPSGGR